MFVSVTLNRVKLQEYCLQFILNVKLFIRDFICCQDFNEHICPDLYIPLSYVLNRSD